MYVYATNTHLRDNNRVYDIRVRVMWAGGVRALYSLDTYVYVEGGHKSTSTVEIKFVLNIR